MPASNQILTNAANAIKSSVVPTGSAKLHTFEVTFTDSGAPTAVTITIRGSIKGPLSADMKEIAVSPFTAPQLTAKAAVIFLVDKLLEYIEVEITTQTGGTSVLYNVWYQGAR